MSFDFDEDPPTMKDFIFLLVEDDFETVDDFPDEFITKAEDWVKVKLQKNGLYDRIFGADPDITLPDKALYLAAAFHALCLAQRSGKATFKTGEVTAERIGEVSRTFAATQLSRFIIKGETQHRSWCGMAGDFIEDFVHQYKALKYPIPTATNDSIQSHYRNLVGDPYSY